MYDILSFGDATIDVFLGISEASASCSIDKRDCILSFNYADKIPVDSVTRIPAAGNGSNNAVGSARLGMKSAMVTIVGNDGTGEQIIAHWKKEHVDTAFVMIDKKRGTNYSTVLNFHGERTILVYHEKRDYTFPAKLAPAKWVYYTSLGQGSEVLHDPLCRYLTKTGAKLVFQPGTFQIKLGKKLLAPMIAASTITIINKEEAQRILENNSDDIKVLLQELRKIGANTAIITDGPVGSYAYDGTKFLFLGIYDVPVVERTGCGDAFATALLAALHYGETLEEAMRWGTANSASVLGYVGPQEGLLQRQEMKKYLKRFTEKPKMF